jgi:carboxyl-terminal processing protease
MASGRTKAVVFSGGAVVIVAASILGTLSLGGGLGPPTPQQYADHAVDVMAEGIDASGSALDTVRSTVRLRVADAHSYAATYPALREAARRLGGGHSSFLAPREAKRFGRSDREAAAPMPSFSTGDGITTIGLPALSSRDRAVTSRYQGDLTRGLFDTGAQASCGYILDLRDNRSVRLWPMLTGLSPLLENGPIMSFEYPARSDVVSVRGNEVLLNGRGRGQALGAIPKTSVPIAILQNGSTSGSAEAVVISFRGQKNVRVFGQPSSGSSTSTLSKRLVDGALIDLAVAVEADRTGTRYGESLLPDQPVSGADAQLSAARDWLSSGCAR